MEQLVRPRVAQPARPNCERNFLGGHPCESGTTSGQPTRTGGPLPTTAHGLRTRKRDALRATKATVREKVHIRLVISEEHLLGRGLPREIPFAEA